mgnify:FL=1
MRLSITVNRLLTLRLALVLLLLGLFVGAANASDVETLYEAAGEGDASRVAALVEGGVDVNGRTGSGSYALNRAAVQNQVEVVRMLLESGADPNVRNSDGDTPLICATKYAGGKPATVEALVAAGTDLTIRDNDGKTALDYAKEQGLKDAVALLEK